MTKARHHSAHHAPASQGRPLKTKVFVLAVVLVCGGAMAISLFERKELPQGLRDSKLVTAAYEARDRAIQKGEEWMHPADNKPQDAESKQVGYEKDDRKKLEALISKGAQGND